MKAAPLHELFVLHALGWQAAWQPGSLGTREAASWQASAWAHLVRLRRLLSRQVAGGHPHTDAAVSQQLEHALRRWQVGQAATAGSAALSKQKVPVPDTSL